jgi:hypothetical protein
MDHYGPTSPSFTVGYRWSSLLLSSVPVCGVLLAGTAYTGSLARNQLVAVVPFVVLAVISLLAVFFYLRAFVRALRRSPLLSLDGEGVTLHSARVRLPWSNVAEVRIDHAAGRRRSSETIVFVPVDAVRAVEELRGMARRFARDGIQRHGGPIFVRVAFLARPLEEILAAVQRSTPAPVRHHRVAGRTRAGVS